MSGPEVANTPGGGAPGKEGKEPVANGHAGESPDANPFAEYMWMENEEEYNRQVRSHKHFDVGSTSSVLWIYWANRADDLPSATRAAVFLSHMDLFCSKPV